jgi:hypothetical protein
MKKNEILSFAGKWMELETITLSMVTRLRRTQIIYSPSYGDFRSRENAVVLLDLDHTLRAEHIREEWG